MAEISVKVTKDRTPEIEAKLEKQLEQFVQDGAAFLEGGLKTNIASAKSGRAYKRGKDKVHIASAPGESPASDSGNLISSIGPPIYPSTLEAVIGTNVEYAPILEAKDGLDRPLWQKTVDESMPTLEKMLEQAVAAI